MEDRTRVECTFNAGDKSDFRVYAGIWGGKAGRLWVDEFKVEDMGCAPPLQREGLSFDVRDARTGAKLTVMKGGEHRFHTKEQMRFLDEWILGEEAARA